MNSFISLRSLLAISAVLSLLLTGCGTTAGVGPTSGSFASTTIKNTNRAAVDQAVIDVFTGDGFQLISKNSDGFTFRKWGGKSTQIVYGDWFTDGVAVSPKVSVTPIGPDTYKVGCNVTMMEEDVFGELEEKWNPVLIGKSAYNGLLRQVRDRAQGASPGQ